MCFVWISEQTAIISLYSINWLVFVTERNCVYCAVRTGCLCIIVVNVRVSSFHTHVRTNVFRPELLQKAHSEKTQSRNLLAMLARLGETFQSSSCRLQVGFVVRLTHRGLTFQGSFTFSSFVMTILLASLRSVTDIWIIIIIIIYLNIITVALVNESQLDSLCGVPLWQA